MKKTALEIVRRVSAYPLALKKWFWPIRFVRPGRLFWFGAALLTLGVLFTGATWGLLDLHQLKEWQTLLAAMIALGAAVIAYRAAMAKVNLDRELAAQELLRRKTGLYLRLHFALHRMLVEAEKVEKKTTWFSNPARLQRDPLAMTDIAVPKEIEEAWDHLELFQIPISSQLHKIRTALEFWRYTIFDDGGFAIVEAPDKRKTASLHLFITTVSGACSKINKLIQAEIGDAWGKDG
jgi:hypothetical protein